MRTDLPLRSPASLGIFCMRVFALLAILAAALCGAQRLAAQAPSAASPHATAHKRTHPHKRRAVALPQPPTPQAATPVVVPAPEMPAWPANEKPVPATVTWDSHGLRIEAANSSLVQILEDVSTATGTKVEGFDADQRIFGVYGPGSARDVLSQLLQGSGYNILLLGDQGQGTPRKIVLSSRHPGSTPPAANAAPANASDEDIETEEPPQPLRPGIPPGGPARTPQQMQQEMQQQMQQRQQQGQQPGQPPNNPPN